MIDLHCHSTYSDGSDSPLRVVELAQQAGLGAIALTDHDSLDGLNEARARADELGIELVNGCEVSCDFEGRVLHVLCYFVDTDTGPIQAELALLRRDRAHRNHLMIARLQELGLPITEEQVIQKAGGKGVGRPHMAAVLKDHGVVRDINDAFERYLGTGRPGYVKKSRVTIEAVIDTTARSGGLCSVAHPYSLDLLPKELDSQIERWAAAGLIGLECYYGRYSPELRTNLVEMARRHRLVPTGGSDYHGDYKPDILIGTGTGDLSVPDEVLDELRERVPS
ncbi:MAG TPA: PHP domain-containing protein [Acidimicrobiales bacterium]|nr:PHP domain-containing protein [Acidimicrobiales bacterium]